MTIDIGITNEFFQKEEHMKAELFSSTKHYCIFEINKETKKHKFVDDYGEDYTAADEICQSMNNFRTADMSVYFCVRCLEKEEFDHIENYSPFISSIMVQNVIK